MSKIHVLSEQLTNMIAAGEVVERPSGILKELIENSLDAHSNQILIETQSGGLEFLSVSDNGEGMDRADLIQAFKRHSTSKVSQVTDLKAIATLGFRGEALPSIASVAKVVATSGQNQSAFQLTIDNGTEIDFKPTFHNRGTTIEVSELFFKVPARLKYLKSPSYEANRNLGLIREFALGYPNVSFKLISDQRQVFASSGNGNVEEVLYQIYGYEVANQLISFEAQDYDFKISGCYASPHIHRGNRYHIYLFLNHRMIRYFKLSSTVVDCFHHFMPVDRFPILVLNIESDLNLVDVNVHPSKWEVRLSKEAQLQLLVEKCLNESLNLKTKPKSSSQNLFLKPMVQSLFQQDNQLPSPSFESLNIQPVVESQNLTQLDVQEKEPAYLIEPDPVVLEPSSPIEVLGQHHGSYILAQDDLSLYIFDQHASMERIRYEYYVEKMAHLNLDQQLLLNPYVFQNRPFITTNIERVNEVCSSFGITFELFNQHDLIVRSIPLWSLELDGFNFINEILDLIEVDQRIDLVKLNKKKLATMACHSSVRFNERLSLKQLQKIVDDLMNCSQPYHCPHGRPTFIKVQASDLLKEFSR